MLRKILFLVPALVLIVLGAVALSGNAKHAKVKVGDPRMAGLMSCMVKDTCKTPRSTEIVPGAEILSLSYKDKDYDLKIMFKNRQVFGINVKTDDGKQVVVDDLDLDGLADLVYTDEGNGGPIAVFNTKDQQHVLESLLAQKLLHEALQVGWDNFVPDEIKNQLTTAPPPAKSSDLDRFKT